MLRSDDESSAIFVGGPIQYARMPGDNEFDRRLRSLIEAVHRTLSDAGHQILSAHTAEDFGDGHVPGPAAVTARDLAFARECDVYVACLPMRGESPYRTDGTHIELGWVTALERPCVVLWDRAHAARYSFLVQGLGSAGDAVHLDVSEVMASPRLLLEAIEVLRPRTGEAEVMTVGGAR